MKGGEYAQIYLPDGEDDFEIRFYRPCENIHGWKKIINFQSQHVIYLEIVPGFGGMSWIWCPPLIVLFQFISSKVELLQREKSVARKHLVNTITKEQPQTRRLYK